jgi:hypothetical protein
VELFLIVFACLTFGVFGFLIGVQETKKKIERELLKVLEEHNREVEKQLKELE